MAGTCDQNQFYISVKFGSHGSNFKAIVGPRELTAEMAEDYNFYENGTHLSLILPYTAKDAVFELLTAESVKSRIDLLLLDRANDWVLADLYLACYFPLKATECHPNGTMTAVAVKVESTRNLKPSQLTLKDQSCTPQFSDDRVAYFSFSVDTCGTTRTFFDNYMMYENEIRLSYNNAKGAANTSPVDPDYRWSLSVNSVEAVRYQAQHVRDALLEVRDKATDMMIKIEAQSLAEEVGSYRFSICTVVWYDIISKVKQSMQLDIAVDLLRKTKATLEDYRATGFASAQISAKDM
ncbi:uncharacterized protein LOC117546199 [Gymnodraco acuticeps]|uniref:Uncharacterized protein LOC117546199 n=1 Tax=Gymnodraco acuticeps TaxID=8218 RepID=A0A6P8U634_GYMAC|nr:uncharacterized protein LOC117546199 [Gymnodraco acuticeps]